MLSDSPASGLALTGSVLMFSLLSVFVLNAKGQKKKI